jgi:hypothetical protein
MPSIPGLTIMPFVNCLCNPVGFTVKEADDVSKPVLSITQVAVASEEVGSMGSTEFRRLCVSFQGICH